jgi:predicted nucleic acid-binding protein
MLVKGLDQALVLVDTCMWVQCFNRRRSPTQHAVKELVEAHRAALIGPILTEVLMGFRREAEADYVASRLRGLELLDVVWKDWRMAARLHRQLIASGHTLPLSDLALAAVCQRVECSIFTDDPHFDVIRGIRRYRLD